MPRNNEREQQLDALIDNFGRYLEEHTNLAPNDCARVQEVCRDFCNFLGKDLNQATSQDYQMYIQIHSVTSNSEADYNGIMNLIRMYNSDMQQDNGSPALTLSRIRNMAAGGGMPSDEEPPALSNLFSTPFNPNESTCDPDFNLFATKAPIQQGNERPVDVNDVTKPKNVDKTNVPIMSKSSYASGKAVPRNDQLPFQANRRSLSDRKPTVTMQDNSLLKELTINKSLSNFDFSMEKTDDLGTSQPPEPAAKRMSIAETIDRPNDGSSSLNAAGQKQKVAAPLKTIDTSSKTVDTSSLRRVQGVSYDFSVEGKRQLLALEALSSSSPNNAKVSSDAIDKRLLNFRSYVFDNKYLIDMPLPLADKFILPGNTLLARGIALTPALLAFVCSLPCFIFLPMLGLVLLVLCLILTLITLPDILPKEHMTPLATVSSFVRCYKSHCYAAAASLIARPISGGEIPSLAALWKDRAPSFAAGLPARFKPSPAPEFRVVTGSEAQNALIMIFEMDDGYYLVPLVRLKTGWFVSDPSMKLHKNENN